MLPPHPRAERALPTSAVWGTTRPPGQAREVALAELAAAQAGRVSRAQLVALGFGRRAIEHRLARGRLHRVHRGVYAVGHTAAAPTSRAIAALLLAGPDAVLSHDAAAAIWGLRREVDGPIDVTIPGREPSRHRELRVHRTQRLAPWEVDQCLGLPLTSPARTLLDLAGRLDGRGLRWAVEEGRVLGIVTVDELVHATAQHRGRRGVARLRRVLAASADVPLRTRSGGERGLIDLILAAELPAPRANVRLHGWEVDLHWPQEGLVVELDGFRFHASRSAFERDRRKDAALQARGLRVVRLSWRQVRDEPEIVVGLLRRLLANEPRRPTR